MSRPAIAKNYALGPGHPSRRGPQGVLVAMFSAVTIAVSGERAQAQTTIVVPANVEWLDTGIDVRAGIGFVLSISATGSWTNVPDGQRVDGAGYGSLKLPNAVAPTETFASLIGRVNETVFGIGNSFQKRSPASGRLFLAMNDVAGTYWDNSGELTVVVTQRTTGIASEFKDPVMFLDLLSADPTPFFVRPSFRWVLRNKIKPSVSGEVRVLLDGVLASGDISPPSVHNLGPNSEVSGTLLLYTGPSPYLSPGDHTVTIQLRAYTAAYEVITEAQASVTTFTPPSPAITIAEFVAKPRDYQDQGKELDLTWKLQPSSSCVPADLVLNKEQAGEPPAMILQEASPANSGSKTIVVKGTSSPIPYRLSVACKFSVGQPTLPSTRVTAEEEVFFGPTPPAPAPYLVINGPFFYPTDLIPKKPFAVSWTFENVGGAKREEFDVDLYLDGVKEGGSKEVPTLDPGKSTNMTWDITKELPSGSHQVELKEKASGSSLSFATFHVSP